MTVQELSNINTQDTEAGIINNTSQQKLPDNWYSQFQFIKGVTSIAQLPPDNTSEVAFAGRSNVGKSSVINKITHRKALARISKSPGRTRELNYFAYEKAVYIVDLPGYGYAKVSADRQKAWTSLLEYYLRKRRSLRGLFLMMDIRHPMSGFDVQMLDYCQSCELPLHIILNKADKLSRCAALKTMQDIKHQLPANITLQLFSVLKGNGVEEAREKLATWLF